MKTEQDLRLEFKRETGENHSYAGECNYTTDYNLKDEYTLFLEEKNTKTRKQ